MHTIPHVTCSKVLDTVRLSGLTYSLTETPYSAYLSIRKKFTKGFSPITSSGTVSLSSSSISDSAGANKFSRDTPASETDTANQLSVKEAELSMLRKSYEKLVIESKNEHSKLTSSINKLTQELASEIDDHAESEHALRRLEEKHETVKMELEKKAKENKALKDEISNCEEEVARYQRTSISMNESLAKTEIKLAEAHNAEAGILTSKVHELEGTVSGKNRVISLLKDQAVIAEKENSILKAKLNELQLSLNHKSNPIQKSPSCNPTQVSPKCNPIQVFTSYNPALVSPPCNPNQVSRSTITALELCKLRFSGTKTSQSNNSNGTSNDLKALADTFIDEHNSDISPKDQIASGDILVDEINYEIDEATKDTDINDNIAPNPGTNIHPEFPQLAEASNTDSERSSQSSPSLIDVTNPEQFCSNCYKKPENDDIDMDLPTPVYEPNFVHDCPSPWLHYGYCTACLEVARFESLQRGQGNAIIKHITQCPGLIDYAWPSEHEEYIQMCTERENEIQTKSHQ